jgi:hypothetical protein
MSLQIIDRYGRESNVITRELVVTTCKSAVAHAGRMILCSFLL